MNIIFLLLIAVGDAAQSKCNRHAITVDNCGLSALDGQYVQVSWK